MNTTRVISVLGLLAMTGIIGYAFAVGNFGKEGAQLLAMPWGQVSMVDLYVGFTIFSMWIVYREEKLLNKIVWVVLMMTLGNWTSALYVLLALNASKGDPKKFFLGKNA